MNRSFLNFEALAFTSGTDENGQPRYMVQLNMNHRPVRTWTLPLREGYLLTQDRGHLDAFIAQKLFDIFKETT